MASGSDVKNLVLIGGGPRSGTTLLADILNENSKIGIMSEYVFDDFVRMMRPLFELQKNVIEIEDREARFANISKSDVHDEETFEIFRNSALLHPGRFPRIEDFLAILIAVFESSLHKENLSIIGAKHPFFTMHHDRNYLSGSVGIGIKYILLVRRPLNQINSSLNRRNRAKRGGDVWHIQNTNDAICEYFAMARLNYSYICEYPDDTLIVLYESLVENPMCQIRRIYDFLGIESEVVMGVVSSRKPSKIIMSREEVDQVNAIFSLADEPRVAKNIGSELGAGEIFRGLVERHPKPNAVYLNSTTPGRPLLGLGWAHGVADDGVASMGSKSYLVFAVEQEGEFELTLGLSPIFPDGNVLNCAIDLDGVNVGSFRWTRGGERIALSDRSSPGGMLLEIVGDQACKIMIGAYVLEADIPHTIVLKFGAGLPDDGAAGQNGGVRLSFFGLL